MPSDNSTTQDDHPAALCTQSTVIQKANILDKVDNETSLAPSIEIDDIAKGTICESRAKYGYVIFPAPVVNAIFIVYFLSNACYYLRRRKNGSLLLLFFEHLLDYGQEPLLKKCVILVWHYKITNPVQTLLSQRCSF